MKKSLRVGAVLALGVALYFFFHSKTPAPTPVAIAAPASPTVALPSLVPASSASAKIPSPAQSSSAAPLGQAGELIIDSTQPADLPPETIVQNVGRAIHQYGETFGGNPVGANPEITSQLSGANPRHINFIDPQPGTRINASGELVDPWGTPYFFHQISGTETEIHSAGPDKLMWTADDLVVK